eukprot:600220-Prymnesium_polylepis.1
MGSHGVTWGHMGSHGEASRAAEDKPWAVCRRAHALWEPSNVKRRPGLRAKPGAADMVLAGAREDTQCPL